MPVLNFLWQIAIAFSFCNSPFCVRKRQRRNYRRTCDNRDKSTGLNRKPEEISFGGSALHGVIPALTGTDTDHVVERIDEDLAVSGMA